MRTPSNVKSAKAKLENEYPELALEKKEVSMMYNLFDSQSQ